MSSPFVHTPKQVNILGAKKHVITVEKDGQRYKLFQIIFASDGSLYIDFPYFKNSLGIASEVILDSSLKYPAENISLTQNGKVTSHLVKYSHHTDGRAHFSQTGKVFTQIKKQATLLKDVAGHMFTIMLQGVNDFERVSKQKDMNHVDPSRTVVVIHLGNENPDSLKFVGRWYAWEYIKDKLSTTNPNQTQIGPQALMEVTKGKIIQGFILGPDPSNPSEKYILYLSCETIPTIYKDEHSGISFMGGFDRPEIINDLSRPTSMLVLSYPINNPEELKNQIGTIDYQA